MLFYLSSILCLLVTKTWFKTVVLIKMLGLAWLHYMIPNSIAYRLTHNHS